MIYSTKRKLSKLYIQQRAIDRDSQKSKGSAAVYYSRRFVDCGFEISWAGRRCQWFAFIWEGFGGGDLGLD